MTKSVIFFEPPIIHKQKEIDMPKQVGGKADGPDVSTERGTPEVEEVVIETREKPRPKPVEPTRVPEQTVMPGVEPPQEDEKTKKSWGEVMVLTALKVPLHKLGLTKEPIEQTPSDEEVEVWVPHEAIFGGGVQEARRFIRDAVEQDKIPPGTYVIARRVSTIRCEVETIRRVETFEDGV